jgi:hypothetical protein
MRRKAVVVGVLSAAMAMAFAPIAAAQESLVTVTTTSTGSRTVTVATAPQFPVAQDLSLSGGTIASTVAASTTLTEVFASGATWSVKAQMCGPDDYGNPQASDCTTYPNQLVGAVATIPGDDMALNRGSITQIGLPRGTATAGGETDLGSQVTLLTSNNEVATTTYNGVYSTTTGLTISNVTTVDTFKGFWIITQTT